MRKILIALIIAAPVLLGQTTERKIQYSSTISRLTEPSDRPASEVAVGYLTSSSLLPGDDLSSIYLAKAYTSPHNGVTHLVYRQRFDGIEVHNGAWVANVGIDGAVLNSGGNLYPDPGPISFGDQIPAASAVRAAVREVNPKLGESYVASELSARESTAAAAEPQTAYRVRYARGAFGDDIEGRLVWFAHRGTLLLAWLFNVVDEDGVTGYDVAVEAATGAVIHKQALTFLQAPRGLVFDLGTPQPNPTPGVRLEKAPPMVERKLAPLTGDTIASPSGWVVNNETAGYNAIVGQNVLGQTFLTNPYRTQATAGNFSFPLSLGESAPNPVTFSDAANVNLFYWVNRAHDLFYTYGFDEAAGNFQSNNFGRGGVGGDAMLAYSHFGAAAPVGPALNNALFSTRSLNDGSPSMIAMFTTTSGPAGSFADGAYSAGSIIHEYGHGVSFRLLPDGYGSFQTASMGEAWSDFFGLEFTLPDGSPLNGSYPVGEYSYHAWGTGIRTRPYSVDTGVNPLTFADMGRVAYYSPEVHAEGEIWVQALWEARANLIQQFGEAEGRRRIRRLVIDGMMLSLPSPSMVDARDAILLADQVNYEGSSQSQLWSAFAKRGLGAVAHSDGGDTIHVVSSFEVPTAAGRLKFYENTFVAGEPIRLILSDSNLSPSSVRVQLSTTAGDVEDMTLRRTGSAHSGSMFASTANVTRQNGVLNIVPGDVITASYTDSDSGSGGASVQATAATQPSYGISFNSTITNIPAFPNEIRLTNVRGPVILTLPFDFPFFSKKYRSMVVYPTGLVAFEPSVFTNLSRPGCNDSFELNRIAGIAPLFANLNFGAAQPNEGIFRSIPEPGTIAIRWAAETLPATPLIGPAVPEPVNVALTLSEDGTIRFYYGTGNQNLHTAGQAFSTCGAQPIAGISNGHDVYSVFFRLRTYSEAPRLTFSPAFNATTTPEVILEQPAADETVRGMMTVRGIAYDTGLANAANPTFVSRRDVLIDGVQRAVALSVARADYCTANAVPGCPLVGFQSVLNVAALNLSPGRHTISVRVTNSRGASKETAPVAFNVDNGPAPLPKGAIEAPAAGAELSGNVIFRGYAYVETLRVSRVDLLIDGVTYPVATYGATRPDVCGTLPAPLPLNCPNVGWTLALNTRTGSPPLPDGPHSMQLRVLDETGRYTMVPDFPVPFTVKNGPQTFPTGAITSVRPNDRLSGIVPISGHAYSMAGRVTSVVLLVDGLGYSLAQYGQPRPEACAALPSAPAACPNIGFSVNLDTRALPNGNHVIGALISNDAGLSVVVPNLVADGMNVTVSN